MIPFGGCGGLGIKRLKGNTGSFNIPALCCNKIEQIINLQYYYNKECFMYISRRRLEKNCNDIEIYGKINY